MQNLGNISGQRAKSLLVESTEINKHSEIWTGSTDNMRQRLTVLFVLKVWREVDSFLGTKGDLRKESFWCLLGSFGQEGSLFLNPIAMGQQGRGKLSLCQREHHPNPGTSLVRYWTLQEPGNGLQVVTKLSILSKHYKDLCPILRVT